MKKLLLTLGACSLAFTPLAISTPALADPGKGPAKTIQEFCTAFVAANPEYTFGNCVGILRSDLNDSAYPAKACLELGITGEREAITGTTSQGQCIKFVKALI